MTEPSYTPLAWADSPDTSTPIDAANLAHVENGVKAATDRAVASVRHDQAQSLPAANQAIGRGNLGLGSMATAAYPDATEKVIFVSTAGSANDSNDGLTVGKAKSTIAGALSALGSNPGVIQLSAGTFTISAADGNGNGATLTGQNQRIRGVGFGQGTTVVINTNATWGIKAQGAYCSVEDVYVTIASGVTVTYAVGVSPAASPGSAQHCHFDRVFVNVQGTCTAAFALGPDFAGSSSIDIACTKFDNCVYNVSGTLTHGWLSGNGTTGNVTANTAVACTGSGSQYGITLNGSGFQWFGGGFANLTSADIHIQQAHGDGAYFAGMRCENGNQALNTGYGGGTGPIVLNGCSFQAYTPTAGSVAGEIITYNLTGPLVLQSGCYTTTGANTSFHVNDSGGTPARIFMAQGVATDVASPYPAASSKVTRVILGATYYNAGTPTPNPSVSVFDSWSPPFDSTAATVKVGSAQTGNVRLQVGSDSAAQTPVIDLKSSGSAPNYDARIMAASGGASDGQGQLRLFASGIYCAANTVSYTDGTYDLGAPTLRWKNVYAQGVVHGTVTKTASYTLVITDNTVIFNGATLTATLPDPTTVTVGRHYTVKNINSSALTVASAGTSKTVDGAASQSLAQWGHGRYVSDGTQWLSV